jgi:lipoprotein-anchoring transpeptidase ErfK/SrfK
VEQTIGAPDERDVESVLRLQAYLDRQGFGPGKVDGKLGEFTRKAVDCYNTTIGLPPGDYSAVMRASERLDAFVIHTVTESDLAWVDPKLPLKPAEQTKATLLRYRSLAEFAAERYHTDENWLRRANPELDLDGLAAGAAIRVPNVVPFAIESLPRPHQWTSDPAFAKRAAVVDTGYRFVCIYEENRMIAAFPITPGEEKFIRRGTWEVVIMQAWPPFRWDKSMLQTGRRSDNFHMLPPGPNSPVGVLWAGLNRPGIGLHGTSTPETIGRARSAGCVRLANWDAARLPNFLRPGAKVILR